MFRKSIAIIAILAQVVICAGSANAMEFFGVSPKGTPSVLNYGWKGLTLGVFMGVACGYLSYERTSTASDLFTGAAYGSLVGVGGGLILGMSDASKGREGTGAIVLRDMHLGGVLGLVVGGIFGGIKVSNGGDWRYLGNSAAWGYLAGTVVGLGIALYEGPKLVKDYSSSSTVRIAYLPDSKNNLCPGLQTVYQF